MGEKQRNWREVSDGKTKKEIKQRREEGCDKRSNHPVRKTAHSGFIKRCSPSNTFRAWKLFLPSDPLKAYNKSSGSRLSDPEAWRQTVTSVFNSNNKKKLVISNRSQWTLDTETVKSYLYLIMFFFSLSPNINKMMLSEPSRLIFMNITFILNKSLFYLSNLVWFL